MARLLLWLAIVRAPFAGVVIAKAAQPGEIVSPLSAGGGYTRTGIGTIVDMDSLEIEVEVGEAFIGRVQLVLSAAGEPGAAGGAARRHVAGLPCEGQGQGARGSACPGCGAGAY